MRSPFAAKVLLMFALSLLLVTCGGDEKSPEPTDAGAEEDDETQEDAGSAVDGGLEEEVRPVQENEALEGKDKELDVLAQALEAKRLELDLREREIIQREQLLESLELAAVQKGEDLKKIKADAQELLAKLAKKYEEERKLYEEERKQREKDLKEAVAEMSGEREDRIDHLVKSVKSMRPSAGAEMLSTMDERDAVMVLRQLTSRKAASLLGEMQPAKAAQLAQGMLGPRLPAPEVLSGEEKPVQEGSE